MNLFEQAESDLSFTLEDSDNGFAIDVTFITPQSNSFVLKCQTTDINFFIDPGTGIGSRARNVEITFRLSTMLSKTNGAIPDKTSKKWKFQFTDVNLKTWNLAIEQVNVDRKLGIVNMVVGLLDVS